MGVEALAHWIGGLGAGFSSRYRQGTKSTFTTGLQCLANRRTSESMGSLTICQGVCRISLIGGWCYNLGSCLMARTPHKGSDNWGQVGTGAVKPVQPRQRARKRNLRLEKPNAGWKVRRSIVKKCLTELFLFFWAMWLKEGTCLCLCFGN